MKPYYDHDGITIYHGDCREIMPGLPKVDLVLTDPPYCVSVAGSAHRGQIGKGVRRLDFFEGDADWKAMLDVVMQGVRQAVAMLSAVASVYVWCGHRQFGSIVDCLERKGMSTRPLVWAKACPAPAPPGSGYSAGAELCVYGYPPNRTWNGEASSPNSVFRFDSYRHGQPGKVDHPTQKPIGMISTQICLSSNEGDTILDPFMGSGTTLRAAKDLHRKAIGIEIEERYCEIAANRLGQEVLAFPSDSEDKVFVYPDRTTLNLGG